jgi:hypothetical protein
VKGSIVAVKYVCMKCGRKFLDWGAEKLGMECPSDGCDNNPLILYGTEEAEILEGAGKGRAAKRRQVIVPRADVDYTDDLDEEFSDDDEADVEEDEDEEESRQPVILSDGDDDKEESDTDGLTTIEADDDELDVSEDDDDEESLDEDYDED